MRALVQSVGLVTMLTSTVQVTPILAIVPLIATWFGYDFTARVVVCVLIAVFPIITNTLHGLLTVDTQLHDLFKLHGKLSNES